jgi:hypothetical protein
MVLFDVLAWLVHPRYIQRNDAFTTPVFSSTMSSVEVLQIWHEIDRVCQDVIEWVVKDRGAVRKGSVSIEDTLQRHVKRMPSALNLNRMHMVDSLCMLQSLGIQVTPKTRVQAVIDAIGLELAKGASKQSVLAELAYELHTNFDEYLNELYLYNQPAIRGCAALSECDVENIIKNRITFASATDITQNGLWARVPSSSRNVLQDRLIWFSMDAAYAIKNHEHIRQSQLRLQETNNQISQQDVLDTVRAELLDLKTRAFQSALTFRLMDSLHQRPVSFLRDGISATEAMYQKLIEHTYMKSYTSKLFDDIDNKRRTVLQNIIQQAKQRAAEAVHKPGQLSSFISRFATVEMRRVDLTNMGKMTDLQTLMNTRDRRVFSVLLTDVAVDDIHRGCRAVLSASNQIIPSVEELQDIIHKSAMSIGVYNANQQTRQQRATAELSKCCNGLIQNTSQIHRIVQRLASRLQSQQSNQSALDTQLRQAVQHAIDIDVHLGFSNMLSRLNTLHQSHAQAHAQTPEAVLAHVQRFIEAEAHTNQKSEYTTAIQQFIEGLETEEATHDLKQIQDETTVEIHRRLGLLQTTMTQIETYLSTMVEKSPALESSVLAKPSPDDAKSKERKYYKESDKLQSIITKVIEYTQRHHVSHLASDMKTLVMCKKTDISTMPPDCSMVCISPMLRMASLFAIDAQSPMGIEEKSGNDGKALGDAIDASELSVTGGGVEEDEEVGYDIVSSESQSGENGRTDEKQDEDKDAEEDSNNPSPNGKNESRAPTSVSFFDSFASFTPRRHPSQSM